MAEYDLKLLCIFMGIDWLNQLDGCFPSVARSQINWCSARKSCSLSMASLRFVCASCSLAEAIGARGESFVIPSRPGGEEALKAPESHSATHAAATAPAASQQMR